MSMFGNCAAVIHAKTESGQKKKKILGGYDDVPREEVEHFVRRLAHTGKYVWVGGFWEKPAPCEDAYRIVEWQLCGDGSELWQR